MSVFNKLFSKSASNAAKTVRNIADKLDNAANTANTVSSQTETTVSTDSNTDTNVTVQSPDLSDNATAQDNNTTATNSRVFVTEESHRDERAQAMAAELHELANNFPRATATVSLTDQNFTELQEYLAQGYSYSHIQGLSNSFTGSLFNYNGIVALRVAMQVSSVSGELCIELTSPQMLWGGPHIDSRIASIEYSSRDRDHEEDYQEENADDYYDDDEFTGYGHDYTQ